MKQKILKLIRYGVSGICGAITHIGVLYILTDIFNIHYLISTTIGYMSAFFVSFFMQKYWTFKNKSQADMRKQMMVYLTVGVMNLCLNALFMRIAVGTWNIYHVIAQILVSGIIAIWTFFIYKQIFKENNENIDTRT